MKPEVEGHTINTERRKINFFFNRVSKDYIFEGIFGFERKTSENGRKLTQSFKINQSEDPEPDKEPEKDANLINIGSGMLTI